MDKTDKLLDIDSWFDEDAESSIIFIFVSCIIDLFAFILLLFLCFKHEKLRKLMSLYMTRPQVVHAAAVNTSCNTGNIFVYILSSICFLILTYAIIKILIRGCRYFRRYQTTTHFLCEHGHDKGPSTTVALKLSTMTGITHVHIAYLNIPITRLSIHETDHNVYYIVSSNWFYDFLKISQPIILLHRNGVIRTPVTFKVRFLQSFKLRCILHTDYLARVVAFQNGYLIPLSGIHVCHSSQAVTPVRTLLTTLSHPDPVATSNGLYLSHNITEQLKFSSITPSPTTPHIMPTETHKCTSCCLDKPTIYTQFSLIFLVFQFPVSI